MKMLKMNFRGNNVLVTNERLKPQDISSGNFFVYELRHSDENVFVPCTIENEVIINHWGTLLSPVLLILDSYLELMPSESEFMAFNTKNYKEINLFDSTQIENELFTPIEKEEEENVLKIDTPLGELKASLVKGSFPGIRICLNNETINLIEYNYIADEIKTIIYDFSNQEPLDIMTNYKKNETVLD